MDHLTAATHGAMTIDVEYKVLGQLSAHAGAKRVKLGGKRQRLVLAVLLANANRVVSQDGLLEAVWNGRLPEGGSRTLHTYISILRKTLGDGIRREGSGYILVIAPDQLDADRFEGLVAEARTKVESDPSDANELLRRGLSLWTGTAYGDLAHELALIPEVTRLTDARAAAVETRFETDLLLGRHEEVVPEVQAVLHEHPYRENVAALLMLALYRSGRQTEALRTYRRMRERLVDELGVEPGPRLQDLELQILESDPRLIGPSTGKQAVAAPRGARGYELHEQIGTTKAGIRFRGFQSTLGREVSVVVIDEDLAGSPRFIQLFEAKMQAAAQLEHPHLAPVFDFWRDPNQACVVSPFYRGGTVQSAMEMGEMSVAAVVRVCDQLATALAFLHRHGHSHGGIDAGSVLFDEEMNSFLGDSGLARMVNPDDQAGPAEDVRQLGGLIFQALTLHRPGQELRITRWRSDLPDDLDHAISRALHPSPELRFERVEDFARALRQSVGLDVMAVPAEVLRQQGPDRDRRNPYKGLRAFYETDAADFHGRDALIDEMVHAMSRTQLLAVVGPSGSGKSSVVRAGLLPKLRRGDLPGSSRWLITDMFPGTRPFESLEAALLRVAAVRPPDLYERLSADAIGLASFVEELLPDEKTGLVILIDQFEELFSLTSSSSERNQFLDALAAAIQKPDGRLRVVLTLRADFFDQPLQHPDFAEALRSSLVTVRPPTPDGFARAISEPARRVAVGLEPGLVTRIVEDVREQPGGLPLLQFALTELFSNRKGDVLTQSAYQALGGVAGTLARRAEATYSGLSLEAQEATRQMFLRLVMVDEVADDTRRRVRQSELLELEIDRKVMGNVIQRFGALRFLSFDRDIASRAPTVELAHEAILREWQRLRSWIDERREDLLVHRRIQMTVQDWLEADRDPSYLLRGVRLQQAIAWLGRTDIAVSDEERKLIEESIDFAEAERAEREALEQKAARRRRLAIWILAGAAVVATGLGLYAVGQRGDALRSASEATSRELTQAAIAITEDDPELGVILAAEAIEMARSAGADPPPESLGALWSAYVANRVELTISGVGGLAIAYSPDGSALAVDFVSDGDSLVAIHNSSTGEKIGLLATNEFDANLPVADIEYSSDGQWIVVGRGEFAGEGIVELFNATTYALTHRIEVAGYAGLALSGTGLLATADVDTYPSIPEVTIWDLESGRTVSRIVDLDTFGAVEVSLPLEFVPGSPVLAIGLLGSGPPRVVGLDALNQQVEWSVPVDIDPAAALVSPSGDHLAISDWQTVALYDLAVGEPIVEPIAHQDPQTVTWSPDSAHLAISGNESDITLIDVATGDVDMVLSGHGGSVWSTAFDPRGGRLASTSIDRSARIWNITSAGATGLPTVPEGMRLFDVTVTDSRVALNLSFGATVVDRFTGAEIRQHDYEVYVPVRPMVADEAGVIAGIADDGTATIADLDTGEVLEFLPRCSSVSAISPDGRFLVLDSSQLWLPATCQGATTGVSGIYGWEAAEILVDYDDMHVRYGAVSGLSTFDGRRYAAAAIHEGDRSRVEVWGLDPLTLLGTVSDRMAGDLPFLLLTFSSDARYLAVGTNGPRALAVDMAALTSGSSVEDSITFNREVHTGNVPLTRFIDAETLVTSSFDGFYRLWDVRTGDLRFEIEVGGLLSYGVHDLSPDGDYLYYEGSNGVIRSMPTDTDAMIALATGSVTRELTDDECRRYLRTAGCE